METLPELETSGEETDTAVSSENDAGNETATESASPCTSEEFEHRVTRLCQMMKDDPDVRDRIIAEIYVNMASAEMGVRGVFEAIQAQGIAGLMKGAFKRGG